MFSARRLFSIVVIVLAGLTLFTSTPIAPQLAQAQQVYNTAFLTDQQLEDYTSMNADQIRAFLVSRNSYFRQSVQDIDGQTFDAATVIAQAATQYRINPKVILATIQKESSAIDLSSRPSNVTMGFLTGCASSSTARQQITCTAERFRAYQDQLNSNGTTVSGWRVNAAKTTVDGISVIPATKAIAGQFTYTPYAGSQWGGSAGGVYLFYDAWNRYGFGSTPSQSGGVNYSVPYVHQVYDTGNSFNGYCACGGTSAVMALAYYGKLTPNAITTNVPSVHNNNYGRYVSELYTTGTGNPINNYIDYSSCYAGGRIQAYGAFGSTFNPNAGGAEAGLIQSYLTKHGVESQFDGALTFNSLKQYLDSGYLVIAGIKRWGHIILIRGYSGSSTVIANDPYGTNLSGQYNGENVQYNWSTLSTSGAWGVIVKGQSDTDDNRSLANNQEFTGSISPNSDKDTYILNITQPSVVQLSMNQNSSSLDSFLELYDSNNQMLTYNDDSNGTNNSFINATLTVLGTYKVVAHSYQFGSGGSYKIKSIITAQSSGGGTSTTSTGNWLTMDVPFNETIATNSERDTYYFNGTQNFAVSITADKASSSSLDTYLDLYDPNGTKIAENDDRGSGETNSRINLKLPMNGAYRVVVRSYNGASSGAYAVRVAPNRGSNLAIGATTTSNQWENSSYVPGNATDGKGDTRWGSGTTSTSWLQIDLGTNRTIDSAVLRWDPAYAAMYEVSYSTNKLSWSRAYATSQGRGGVEALRFNSPITARYVLVNLLQRAPGMVNYSLWEVELYNSTTILVPTVPPGDPNKPDETNVTPLIPLPPYSAEKGEPLLALPSQQEVQPLFDDTVSAPTPLGLDATYTLPTANISLSTSVISGTESATASATNSKDNDSNETGKGITAYRWSVVLSGPSGGMVAPFSDQETVTIAKGDLFSAGTNTLMLEVQDNEGNWSEPVTTKFTIQAGSNIYLPLIVK